MFRAFSDMIDSHLTDLLESDDDDEEEMLFDKMIEDSQEEDILDQRCEYLVDGNTDLMMLDDEDLLFEENLTEQTRFLSPPSPSKLKAIAKIESVFEEINTAVMHDSGEIVIDLARRPTSLTTALPVRSAAVRRPRKIRVPGSTPQETWKFCQNGTTFIAIVHCS